jgi:hypothetical protein
VISAYLPSGSSCTLRDVQSVGGGGIIVISIGSDYTLPGLINSTFKHGTKTVYGEPFLKTVRRMIITILVVGLIALVIKWILKPEPSPIFGIYSQPGKFYYLKFAAFYLLVTLRKVKFVISFFMP